ncbi:MAG: hypothetical protein U1F54_00205 [Burkholderiales bacterium]
MSGQTLTVASTLQCPHGGSVTIVSSNTRVQVAGTAAALATDTFTVTGCPFQIPATPPIPSPCVTVQWLVPDTRAQVGGTPTLSQTDTGLCLSAMQVPQGPVSVVSAQARCQTK